MSQSWNRTDFTMIIPIGVDCGMAEFLKKYNLRSFSFPFDWTVTYNGVSSCIKDDFKFFTTPLDKRINKYDIYFHHDFLRPDLVSRDTENTLEDITAYLIFLSLEMKKLYFVEKGMLLIYIRNIMKNTLILQVILMTLNS